MQPTDTVYYYAVIYLFLFDSIRCAAAPQVDGYISGVTNPMFTTMEGTWDLLCVLDLPNQRGTVQTLEEYKLEESLKTGKTYNAPPAKPAEQLSHELEDLKFVTNLLSGTNGICRTCNHRL
jgi:hypothetical protein